MSAARIIAGAVALSVFCLLASPGHAGFKHPRNSPNPAFDGFPLGDGTNSDANKTKIQPTIDKLGMQINAERAAMGQPPLAGNDLQTAAKARFDAIRANVVKAAELVACQIKGDVGEAASKCITDLLAKGSVCIDFGNGAQGAQFCDSSPECKMDKINIDVKKFGTTVKECYDPMLYDATMTLYEEVRHALQDFTATAGANADITRAKCQHMAVCNERDVDDRTIPINMDLITALDKMLMNMAPAPVEPINKKLIMKLQALPNGAAKTAAIQALKTEAEKQKAFDTDTRACYDAAKQALADFIAGTINKTTLNQRLGRIKWQIPGQTAPIPRPQVTTTYQSNSSTGTIIQNQEGTIVPLNTGLMGVYDTHFLQDGAYLLISGVTPGGQGTVLIVPDPDDNEIYLSPDVQVAIPPTPQLQLNLDLFQRNGGGGPVYIYDALQRLIYPLIDTDTNQLPDALGPPINSPDPLLEWVRHFKMTDDNRIMGFENDSDDGNYPPNLSVFELVDPGVDGFYEQLVEHSTFGDVGFAPAPLDPPVNWDFDIDILAMESASLEVYTLDPLGFTQEFIGFGFTPSDSHQTTIYLFRPVFTAENLLVIDATHGLQSNPIPVQACADVCDPFCYQGYDACDPSCELDCQACCLPFENSCVLLPPGECLNQGGTPSGSGTDCETDNCGGPDLEACCHSEGCGDSDPNDCAGFGGVPLGPGTSCATTTCDIARPEACCLPNATCIDLIPDGCYYIGGEPQGFDSTCAETVCQELLGACCLPDGSCVDGMPEEACFLSEGSWNGADSTCEFTTCYGGPSEACCYYTGYCEDVPPAQCIDYGGTPQGPETDCGSVFCEAESYEACCFSDNSCGEFYVSDCINFGGTPGGPGSTCLTTFCDALPAACCYDDGSCADLTPLDCSQSGGRPGGLGSTCATADCIKPELVSVSSRRDHGPAGHFEIPLPLPPGAGVESRSGGPTQIVFITTEFVEPVDHNLDCSEVIVTGATCLGVNALLNGLEVELNGVNTTSCVSLTLQGLQDTSGNPFTGPNAVDLRVIRGDVDSSGVVNIVDLNEVKQRLFMNVDINHFRYDVNADGVINIVDLNTVKGNLFAQLLNCP